MIQLGLLGASGRMGQRVKRLLQTEYETRAKLAIAVRTDESVQPLLGTQVVIDFSSPDGMAALAEAALAAPEDLPAFIVASTGWTPKQRRTIEKLAEFTPIVMASNLSVGIMALHEILKTATPLLKLLGYAPVLVETHHRHKKDAPSGTALSLRNTIQTFGLSEPLQMHSVRAGEVIGDHEVTFYGPSDHLVLGHYAQDRSIFARGAIDVALWLSEKKTLDPKLSGMFGIEAYLKDLISGTKMTS